MCVCKGGRERERQAGGLCVCVCGGGGGEKCEMKSGAIVS